MKSLAHYDLKDEQREYRIELARMSREARAHGRSTQILLHQRLLAAQEIMKENVWKALFTCSEGNR